MIMMDMKFPILMANDAKKIGYKYLILRYIKNLHHFPMKLIYRPGKEQIQLHERN